MEERHKHEERGRNSRRKQTREQLTVLLPARRLHPEEHDAVFAALRSALERCAATQREECKCWVPIRSACSPKEKEEKSRLTSLFQYRWFLLSRRREERLTKPSDGHLLYILCTHLVIRKHQVCTDSSVVCAHAVSLCTHVSKLSTKA